MAYNDSPDIKPGLSNEYDLGDYTFSVTSTYDSQRNKTDIMAYCGLSGEGISKSAVKTISVDGDATVDSWRVEANEYEASVYASMTPEKHNIIEPFIPSDLTPGATYGDYELRVQSGSSELIKTVWYNFRVVTASLTKVEARMYIESTHGWLMGYDATNKYTYKGKTVYFTSTGASFDYWNTFGSGQPSAQQVLPVEDIAWIMFYGDEDQKGIEYLVAKFPIEIGPAGGGGWDIPGDTGDPSYTLHVTVNGASSGTHDDTYNAADNESVKGYGFGGDGGYGGGGGAGASTTIINEFATDKAGYVDQRAYAQSPGLGGMGGKGGKGGDGCILIFY